MADGTNDMLMLFSKCEQKTRWLTITGARFFRVRCFSLKYVVHVRRMGSRISIVPLF